MKPKFKDVLDMIEPEELMKIKKDIEDYNGSHLKALVDSKLKIKVKTQNESVCSTCLGAVSPFAVNNYTLLFGPEDFKKKVNFCSVGCMDNFMKNMEKSRSLDKGFSSSIRLG